MPSYRAIADYYDAEYESRDMLAQDVPFFLGQLPKKRQSILELAVGTGRAAIPMAQSGHRVIGVDYDAQMVEIARRKRDSVGLCDRELKLLRQDVLKLEIDQKFDWIVLLFNTLANFNTIDQQDRLLQGVRKHLKRTGRFWIDMFNPDLQFLSQAHSTRKDPILFYVPHLDRAVMRHSEIRPDQVKQNQRVIYHYRWFDKAGHEKKERVEFDLTWFFPRELQLLLERNGLRIERMFGNYDGSAMTNDSPRIIARCVLNL